MKIRVDSREKLSHKKHILGYFDKLGIEYVVAKCDVGDYQIDGDDSVSVDIKQDMEELVNNLTNDHNRFSNMCKRAKENGTQLIILTEEEQTLDSLSKYFRQTTITTINGATGEKKERRLRPVMGESLIKMLITLSEKYGVKFRFCRKENSGKKIIHYLQTRQLD